MQRGLILILQLYWICMTKESRQMSLLESLQPRYQGLSSPTPGKRRDPGIDVEVLAFSGANGFFTITAEPSRAHWLIFIFNKRTDT